METIIKAIKTKSCQTRRGTKYLRVYYEDGDTQDYDLGYFNKVK